MEYIKLKHIAKYPTGKLNSNAAEENGIYPFFTCSHDIYRINTYAYDGEYVLLGGNNATGDFPIFYYNGKFNAYQRTYLIQPKDTKQYDTRYLFYSIGLKLSLMQNNAAGTATRFLTQPILDNINIEYRPLPIQQKIASILSTYDNLIQNYKKQIEDLQTCASELYKEWFVRFRFPGYQTTQFENGIPVGWEVERLRDVVQDVGKTISKSDIDYKSDTYIPIDCIPNHNMALSEVSGIENAESSLQHFESGDILFGAMRVYFHKVIIAPMQGVTRKTCFVINSSEPILRYYLYLLLFQDSTINYANTISVGATMPYVRWNDFMRMQCLIPKKELLLEFNKTIEPIMKKIVGSYSFIQNLIQQRDLLLPRLMSGKLEIK